MLLLWDYGVVIIYLLCYCRVYRDCYVASVCALLEYYVIDVLL